MRLPLLLEVAVVTDERRSARPTRIDKTAPMEGWLYWARCAGVRDFTEWPRASRQILCDACTVAEPCHEWQQRQRCDRSHRVRRDDCAGCQDFTAVDAS